MMVIILSPLERSFAPRLSLLLCLSQGPTCLGGRAQDLTNREAHSPCGTYVPPEEEEEEVEVEEEEVVGAAAGPL